MGQAAGLFLSTTVVAVGVGAGMHLRAQRAHAQPPAALAAETTTAEAAATPAAPVPAAAAASAMASTEKGVGSGASYLRMKKVTLMDKYGFEKPIPALTMLVPTDWTFEGDVLWYKAGGCEGTGIKLSAAGPDGRTLSLIPEYHFQWGDAPGTVQLQKNANAQKAKSGVKPCGVMKPMSAGEFLRTHAVPQLLPHDRFVSVEPLPKLTEQLESLARQREASSARAGLHLKVTADAARARTTSTVNGNPTEAWMTAVVDNQGTLGPTFGGGRMGQSYTYWSEARMMYVFRAPEGRLDSSDKLFKTMIGSVQFDPTWVARMTKLANGIAAIKAKGARDRAKIVADTQKDIAAIRKSSIDYREQAQDQQAKNFSQYIRGTETYRDPTSGQKVELSSQYGHAWVSGNGEYLLSDSPNFDPNTVSTQGWTALQHTDP